jgi:beta-glucosidase
MKCILVLITALAGAPLTALPAAGADAAPALSPAVPFRNPDLPGAQRVEDLLSRLTVAEKISQLMMASPAIPRLDIPEYDWWNEALHGVARNGTATVFPQAIGFAATWNPELIQRMADAISTEARAKNNQAIRLSGGGSARYAGLTIWSPNINIFRDPRWGRGQETYGEDPFLTSLYAVAFVRGLQGTDTNYLKTVATVKHFAVHSGPERLRHKFDAVVSEHDLRETYLPAFEAGIREGGAQSLMSAYNAVDGVPASASKRLLTDILRTEWGFNGAVVGDVDSVADIWKPGSHRYAPDAAAASALALKAGNDLCSGTTYEALPEALQRGLITEKDLDNALRRLMLLRFKLGQFDPALRVGYRKIPFTENDSPAHDQLALEVARQSLVLLKNDGTLPWKSNDLKTLAVIGPTGEDASALLGNYSGTPSRQVTLAQGIKARLEPLGVKVLTDSSVPLVKGYRINGQPFPAAVLFTDASRSQAGLKGEVFKNVKFEGAPAATRTDAAIDFQWDEAQPVAGIPISKASLRWSGVLIPPTSGEHVLSLAAEGSVRLFLDNTLVIDGLRKPVERTLSVPRLFNAGQVYKVRLEFSQTRPRAHIQFGWRPPGQDDAMERALAVARQADHIVLTLGLTPDLEGEEMSVSAEGFDGGDRKTILLPAIQRELLQKVSALKKPTVVVLTCGSAVSIDPDQANAILNCWYYGQRGADAVAEALLGDCNPAGRLPITFYRSDSDLPPFEDYSMSNRTYRYFNGKPLFAFGHGLSYTTFDYKTLTLSLSSAKPDESVTARVTVSNTGKRDGDEVVQVYAAAEKSSVPMPLRQLVGFKRVSLKAGETKTVEIVVPVNQLRRWNESEKGYSVDPGAYKIAVGPASDQLILSAPLQLHAPTAHNR